MDEKMQYADMLDMPVNTSSITTQAPKKKRSAKKKKIDAEQVKAQLITQINQTALEDEQVLDEQPVEQTVSTTTLRAVKPKRFNGKIKLSVVTLQIAIIGVLIATIFITNSVYPNSGLNVFMRGVLGVEQTATVDDREFSDFTPVLSFGDGSLAVSNGVMTITGEGSVYSSCDGKVTALTKGDDGKYLMEITHSQNFVSVFSGIDYAYSQVGDAVYKNIPVGYVNEDVSMCFKGADGALIENYTVENNQIIWAV